MESCARTVQNLAQIRRSGQGRRRAGWGGGWGCLWELRQGQMHPKHANFGPDSSRGDGVMRQACAVVASKTWPRVSPTWACRRVGGGAA